MYLSNLTIPPSNPKYKGHSDTEQQLVTLMLMKKTRLIHHITLCTLTSASSGPSNAVTPICINNDTTSQLLSPFKPGELDYTDVALSSIGGNSCEDIEYNKSSDDDIPDNPDEDEDERALYMSCLEFNWICFTYVLWNLQAKPVTSGIQMYTDTPNQQRS